MVTPQTGQIGGWSSSTAAPYAGGLAAPSTVAGASTGEHVGEVRVTEGLLEPFNDRAMADFTVRPKPVASARSCGFEWLARAGFVARGAVYLVIGILAIKLATGSGSVNPSQQGALKTVGAQPFGRVLLIFVAAGLAGYALWRLVRALRGVDHGLDRMAALASGVVYAGLCALAVEILLGTGGGSGNAKSTTAGVLGWPAGTWLVGIGGAVLVGVGLDQGYRGVSEDFLDDSKTEEMSSAVRAWIASLGTVGYLARMVVFVLVGVFLIRAAVDYNPDKAVGLDGALAKVDHASYGPLLLGVVAAGLIAFGVYSLADSRYRRI